MVRRISAGVWLLAFSMPFLGEADADTAANAPSPLSPDNVIITTVNYVVPAVHLVRDTGENVSLQQELDDGRPVVMNFVFTTCATTCPLSSQTFAEFQNKLGPQERDVHLVSISIDPENDTPQRLRDYARTFHAGPQWQHYTGTLQASLAVQQSFGAYRGDKMSHVPLTLLRAAPGDPWTRIEGFVTPDELLHRYRQLLAR
jgi:protein SCO1